MVPLAAQFVTFARLSCLMALGALLACLTSCSVVEWTQEGEACSSRRPCSPGLSCTARIGEEYGTSPDIAICEVPRAVYGFIAHGERGESRRIDEALDMLDGRYVLPRMAEDGPGLVTVAHSLPLTDGTALDCSPGGDNAPCLVPAWSQYFGTELEAYPRFILFGLRMTGALLYTEAASNAQRVRTRLAERTGRRESSIPAREVRSLRRRAGHLALAVFDSFVLNGHRPFALDALPACYAGTSGYLNPNASWAPQLAHWDPSFAVGNSGRLTGALDVPIDCARPDGLTYAELRESLWDRHASSFRALALTNAYFHFRGLLPPERQAAWLRVLQDTGNALSLPSSFEPGDNHGITEAAALLQLSVAYREIPGANAQSADAWLRLGRHRLNDVVADTVFSDGVQVEQSPFYHVYELSLLLQAYEWLQRNGLELATGIDPRYATDPDHIPPAERLDYDTTGVLNQPDVNELNPRSDLDLGSVVGKMARAAAHLGQPDGWMPMLGSSLPLQVRGYQPQVFEPFFDRGGPSAELFAAYHDVTGRAAPPLLHGVTVFEDSGFATLHGPGRRREAGAHVLFHTGLPFHGHSHADSLSVHLYGPEPGPRSASGLPLLIDSGWFSYRRTERHYFESTLAHNTVVVDRSNQCLRDTNDKRVAPYEDAPALECERLVESTAQLEADNPLAGRAHAGLSLSSGESVKPWSYQSARHGLYADVTHRRGTLLLGSEALVVLDELEGESPHAYSQLWHLTPEAEPPGAGSPLPPETRAWIFLQRDTAQPQPLLSLYQLDTDGRTAAHFHYGEPDIGGVPGLGWHSFQENQREPNVVAEFRREGAPSAHFVSIFSFGALAEAQPRATLAHTARGTFRIDLELPESTWQLSIEGLGEGAPVESVLVTDIP